MSDRLISYLYCVADTDAGWQVWRYRNLDHTGAPVVLGTYATEDDADAAVDADVASLWWTNPDALDACGADQSLIAMEA